MIKGWYCSHGMYLFLGLGSIIIFYGIIYLSELVWNPSKYGAMIFWRMTPATVFGALWLAACIYKDLKNP